MTVGEMVSLSIGCQVAVSAYLCARPAQQLGVGVEVFRGGAGVIEPRAQSVVDGDGNEGLGAIGDGLPTLISEVNVVVELDQIADVVAEISGAEADAVVEQRLLEAEIVAAAGLRQQARIAHEAERPLPVELIEIGRLEAGAVARLELGFGDRDDEGRRHAPGVVAAEGVVVVVANIGDKEKPLGDFRLEFEEAGLVAGFRREIVAGRLLVLPLEPGHQDLAGHHGEGAVPLVLLAGRIELGLRIGIGIFVVCARNPCS